MRLIIALFSLCFLAAFIALALGCSSTPATASKSFPELARDAAAVDDAIVILGTSLVNAGTITPAQARKVLTITDQVQAALTLANATYAAGDTTDANSQLAGASGKLTKVQGCIGAPSVGATLDTCLGDLQ